MPCLVLTGHPSVGKTEFAKKLGERALNHKSRLISFIEIVNEESVCMDKSKSECYASSHAEKSTRSALKAKVDRSLTDSTLVICDSLNYIKGYRYELHCLSKAAKQRHGVIWILNAPSVAQQWNKERSEVRPGYYYTDDQIQGLIQRYEPPDARNRWDNPLWRIDLSGNTTRAAQEALQQSVYNMHDLSEAMNATDDDDVAVSKDDCSSSSNAASAAASAASSSSTFKKAGAGFKRTRPTNQAKTVPAGDERTTEDPITTTSPTTKSTTETVKTFSTNNNDATPVMKTLDEQIDDILDAFLLHQAPLKDGLSTRQHVNAQSNVLHEVDSLTLQVCNALVVAQENSYGSRTVTLSSLDHSNTTTPTPAITMSCPRHVPLTELKRLRKQYVRWVANAPPENTSKHGLTESFVRYIEAQIDR